jgi:GT2 family glycosyltransferase
MPDPHALVVICTKDRPHEVEMACAAVRASSPDLPILVMDASETEATRAVCEKLGRAGGEQTLITYRRAERPGLARQRNEAIALVNEMGVQVVHFIDDDVEVFDGYFDAIESRFERDPEAMGVGGIIVNQPTVNYVRLKAFFLLGSHRRGTVLRSGRNVLGQYPGTSADDRVDWLKGCSMSFRAGVFDELAFDDTLESHSVGEDYDFTYRLSRKHRLVVEPGAKCVHHFTSTMRVSPRVYARLRFETTHRWVKRHRALGMSLAAFWWSAIGEVVLGVGQGIVLLKPKGLQEALGVVDGVLATLRGRA